MTSVHIHQARAAARPAALALAALAALAAQPASWAQSAPTSGAPTAPKSEVEIVVPAQGGAADVPIHAGRVCLLSFPSKLLPRALAGSTDYKLQPLGEDMLAVRTDKADAAPSTIALLTDELKVNVTLRVVPPEEPALTMVRFKALSDVEAFEARVAAEVEKRLGPAQQRIEEAQRRAEETRRELEQAQKELDALIRRRSDRQIADQLIRRRELRPLKAHARNLGPVILHVVGAMILGDDGYLFFEIENRTDSPYPLAVVRVRANGRDVAGDAYLSTSPAARDPALIGVVAPGHTERGVVMIPLGQTLRRRPLALEISMANGRGAVRVARGVEL